MTGSVNDTRRAGSLRPRMAPVVLWTLAVLIWTGWFVVRLAFGPEDIPLLTATAFAHGGEGVGRISDALSYVLAYFLAILLAPILALAGGLLFAADCGLARRRSHAMK